MCPDDKGASVRTTAKTSSESRRLLTLFSLVLLIVPMIVFPDQFGMDLARFSMPVVVLEFIYFGMASFFLNHKLSSFEVFKTAVYCFMYRTGLGVILGLLIALTYSLSIGNAMTLALWSYLPAMFLHIASTPFVMKQSIADLYRTNRVRPMVDPVIAESNYSPRPGASVSRPAHAPSSMPISSGHVPVYLKDEARSQTSWTSPSSQLKANVEPNGFERATRYIGEHGSVLLAAVVDNEGLLLSNFTRGNMKADDWSPLSLVLFDSSAQVLCKGDFESERLEKVDLIFKDKRLIAARDRNFTLLVIAERYGDDVLNIRTHQGMEIISKYLNERYRSSEEINAENEYVSSAQ